MAKEHRYMAVGRYIDGVNVLGYLLRDSHTQKVNLIDRKTVENLALNKLIGNITAQLYEGKVILKGVNCKLNTLPSCDHEGNIKSLSQIKIPLGDKLVITSRIMNKKNIIGYVIQLMCNGVQVDKKSISREDVLRLAKDGYITNARVQYFNRKPVLRGVNCDLAQLPIIKVGVTA